MSDLAALLAPPSEADVARALRDYLAKLSAMYGTRLVAVYLFGSRARADHRPDSDADIAVVLTSVEGSTLEEKMRLVDLGFDALTDFGLMIQPWPFTQAEWDHRSPDARFAGLLAAAKQDGRRLELTS